MSRQDGFTLIELLVVLAIMGIMLAFIPVVAMPGINSARFLGKVQGVALQLEAAHVRAMSAGQPVSISQGSLTCNDCAITFSASNKNIFFFPDGSATGGQITVRWRERTQAISVNQLSGDISMSTQAKKR